MFKLKELLISIGTIISAIIAIFFFGKKAGRAKERAKNLEKDNINLKKNIKNAIESKKKATKNNNLASSIRLERLRERRKD